MGDRVAGTRRRSTRPEPAARAQKHQAGRQRLGPFSLPQMADRVDRRNPAPGDKRTCPMAEMAPPYGCAYAASYPTTASAFWEPLYVVTIHDMGPTAPEGNRPAPRALMSLDVPFSKGSSTYAAPPLYSW